MVVWDRCDTARKNQSYLECLWRYRRETVWRIDLDTVGTITAPSSPALNFLWHQPIEFTLSWFGAVQYVPIARHACQVRSNLVAGRRFRLVYSELLLAVTWSSLTHVPVEYNTRLLSTLARPL